MVKKIIVLIGIFILLFGSIGFIIEISSYFSSSDYDIFGMVLSVIFIVAGYLVFKFGKNKDKKIDKEKNDIAKLKNKKKNKFHVKIISILGIIFSITNIVIALLIIFSGGVFISSLFGGSESGWGILGFGISFIGILILAYSVLKLTGYIKLFKFKHTGYVLVMIVEIFTAASGVILIFSGYWILFILPFIWSLFVIIYLYRKKTFFRKNI
ncbi:MAG: hypothetical protein FXF47_00855 [Candidatus Mcinerneyibacterium aminivorans]|uniref:Uncharacterized protein n=1 Tax=Candidatus Mcinerneyibacterium aminivorans TaxID=2703815 RepID=A0A5D0MEI2_9BACT|nr:MAG: hypothetical protein FXF47_00855 [Candidatus Mcinerneyibacterium aminivorans]